MEAATREQDEPRWSGTCRAHAEALGVGGGVVRLLDAFPRGVVGPEASWSGWASEPHASFAALESAGQAAVHELAAAIVERLCTDVPRAVAEEQARRFSALLRGLGGLEGTEAPLLRVGLLARMSEVLRRPERRRSRVRDLVDFYFGHASVLRHRNPRAPRARELILAASWREVAPGIEHATVAGHTTGGPLHANLLRARAVRLQVVHRHDATVPLEALVRDAGAAAAISGGFTLSSDMDIEAPSIHADAVGLLLQDGEVGSPPVFRRACLLDGPRGPEIDVVGPVGLRIELAGASWAIVALDDDEAIGRGPVAFRRTYGSHGPAHSGWSLALLGSRVIAAGRGALPIPKAGMVVTLPAELEPSAEARRLGASVRYRLPREVRHGVAAGPMLVRDGRRLAIELATEDFTPAVPPYTFAADETFGQNLLPRMVAGLGDRGELVLVAIDGRDFVRGVGMTLDQCAGVLEALGCKRGMNLDGGDSKRMVVGERVVDLPGGQLEWDASATHPATTRPVYSAVLLGPR